MLKSNLIRRAQRGDRKARNRVLTYAFEFVQEDDICKYLGRRLSAEFDDLVQTFMVRLERKVDGWWENRYHYWFRKWWSQHIIDVSRSSSRSTVVFEEWEDGKTEDPRKVKYRQAPRRERVEREVVIACDKPVIERQVQVALDTLSEGQREVIKLRWNGLTYQEIAEELGISGSAVSSRINRARQNEKFSRQKGRIRSYCRDK